MELPFIATGTNEGGTSSIRGKKRTNRHPSGEPEEGLTFQNSVGNPDITGDISLSHTEIK